MRHALLVNARPTASTLCLEHLPKPSPWFVGAFLCLGLLFTGVSQASTASGEFFVYSAGPTPPPGLEGAFAERVGGALLVVGGQANRAVYRLADDSDQWQVVGQFEAAIHHGASAVHAERLICVGGAVEGQPSRRVDALAVRGLEITHERLPDLPFPIENPAATVVAGGLYVAGFHEGANVFLSLSLTSQTAEWESLPPWDTALATQVAVASMHGKVYLFTDRAAEPTSGVRAFTYEARQGWQHLGVGPFQFTRVKALPCGDAHLLLFDESGREIHGFYTVTSGWAKLGDLPADLRPWALTSQGLRFDLVADEAHLRGTAVFPGTKYGYVDHAIVVAFFVGMLFIGKRMSKRERGGNDYFRGGQRVPFWAAGLSMFATGASAISLMAMPGKAFSENWIYFTGSLFQIMMLPITLYFIVPLARRLRVATAFEYLERRFCPSMRLFGSIIFSINQMLSRMAAIMLLPAIALSAISGIPMSMSILIMGIITTIYATMGGLEAVIWTDVIQAVVMLLAMMLCVVWVFISIDLDLGAAWAIIDGADKLRMADWSLDLAHPIIYMVFLGNIMIPLLALGDQNFIQRVQCTKDERSAQKAVVLQLFVAIPLNFCLFALGTCLFVFYHQNPQMLSPAMKADGVFPLFAAQMLPIGLAGLVAAALMAATMSTLSSAVNSVANVGVEDFLRRLRPNITDHGCLISGRIMTALLGAFGTGAALVLANTSLTSIWDLTILISGAVTSPLMGAFLLGIFTRRANNAGILAGILGSFFATFYMRTQMEVHPFGFPVVSILSCVAVGYLVSRLLPATPRDLTGLTVYTLPAPEDNKA